MNTSHINKDEPIAQCENCKAPLYFNDDFIYDVNGIPLCRASTTAAHTGDCYKHRVEVEEASNG